MTTIKATVQPSGPDATTDFWQFSANAIRLPWSRLAFGLGHGVCTGIAVPYRVPQASNASSLKSNLP